MSQPTEADIIQAIEEIITIFAQRQHVSDELPSAEVTRTFDISNATLAVSLMYDLSGQYCVAASYNGVEFFIERDPWGATHTAYEDAAIPLIPLFLAGIRDVAEGTCILGVAKSVSVDSVLTQTTCALAAIGTRLDTDDMPVTHQIAVVYERLREAVQALLKVTATALQRYWEVRLHDAHACAVRALEDAIFAYDAVMTQTTH